MSKDNSYSPKGFLEANQKTLGEMMLSYDRRFIIPLNQRPWSWIATKDVQHFLDDFEQTLENFYRSSSSPKWKSRILSSNLPHFFGTFVFYGENKELEVFDGQQRLTVVLMLCAVLREIASQMGNPNDESSKIALDAYGEFDKWLRVSASGPTRLSPNDFFSDLFNALIFDPVEEKRRQEMLKDIPENVKEHGVAKKLQKSFYHIQDWIFI